MKHRLTFANVIGVLLENKKKTYPQHQMIRTLFSAYLDDELIGSELIAEDNTMYSRWCNWARPIPLDIIRCYEDDDNWDVMEDDFEDKIIPNLINETQARSQMEELITDSISVIGKEKADELCSIRESRIFFTAVVRYAILNDHNNSSLFSHDLTDILLGAKCPSCTSEFVGRKAELKEAEKKLSEHSLLFVNGIAGIGKSEFAKAFAEKYKKKYTNIVYIHYSGSLKKDIAGLIFADDTLEMTEEELFDRHYRTLQKLHSDSLLIIDNFNVLPKDDNFFRELIKNDFQILITTRCKITRFSAMEIKELDSESELPDLFCRYCPSAKSEPDTVAAIIKEVKNHTLTVCMAALTLEASGMEPEELLQELKACGLNMDNGEEIEIYKDEEFQDARMMEHLRKLLQLSRLSESQTDILRNLSLLPLSGIFKAYFRKWMCLDNANEINHLIRYGFIMEDTENKKIALHPLIQEIVLLETLPSVSNCKTMLDSLHLICLAHGLDVRKPQSIINSLISICDHIINDMPEYYLLFLQDTFPYFDKYLVTDYLPKLVERMEYVMNEMDNVSVCDKTLILDYKAELLLPHKEYDNAVKKLKKAVALLEEYHTGEVTERSANLLSNLYNNLSNTYLLMGKSKDAVTTLKAAFEVRQKYADYGLLETHDTLQQMMNLVNMLILSKDFDAAEGLTTFYENLVLENLGKDCIDYGVCLLAKGIISYALKKTSNSETFLLSAEAVFNDILEEDNGYSKTTCQYLYNLYRRWQKPELAEEYKQKLLISSK